MIERTADVPSRWDDEADVVVLGSGAAGLSSALVAAEGGATVLVLERTPLIGGTSAVSGGTMWIPDNPHTRKAGFADSREDALAYMRALAGGGADEAILETLVDRGPEMVRFMEERFGFAFEPYPAVGPTLDYRYHLPGARHGGRSLDLGFFALDGLGEDAARLRRGSTSSLLVTKTEYYGERQYMYRSVAAPAPPTGDPRIGGGAALVGHLLKAALERGARVLTGTPAGSLAVEGGRVVGVVAEDGRALRARAGVVIATGGFEWNPELKRRYLSRPLTHPASPEDVSQGDGIALGAAVGAGLAGLGDAWWTPVINVCPDGPAQMGGVRSVMCRAERGFPHSIVVNARGRRFVNEALNYYDMPEAFGTRASGPANLPAWLIVDAQFAEKYPLVGTGTDGVAAPDPAWLTRADSLDELASRTGIDAGGLADTIERFNGFAWAGVDADFGRGESHWDREWGDPNHGPNPSLGTLERAPFFAVELKAGALGTKGGLRIDARGRVLSAAPGEPPIPGLYAAGNVACCNVPWGYTGPGATLGPAVTFGYVIGRELAQVPAEPAAV
jgi:3-oxosteroid 1-dehydrogenase